MSISSISKGAAWCALAVGLCAGGSAWSGKPDWAADGHGRGEQGRRDKDEKHERRDDGRDERDRYQEPVREPQGHYRDGGDRSSVSLGVSVQLAPGVGVYFGTNQRSVIHDYYRPQIAVGKCPPGLAKKHNGCLPPGQAKKWVVGQRLPAGVVTYPLPNDLRRRLGPPPAGHEFVRVAGDILLIAIGTSMVIDAIEDLSGR